VKCLRGKHRFALALLLALPATAFAQDATTSIPAHQDTEIELPQAATATPVVAPTVVEVPTSTRSGREIYQRFRDGLADKSCGDSSPRWRSHFSTAPKRMATRSDDVLPLFGYVVDALRDARLPTEYALIPFVESGYKPGARSPGGPVGLWQFIAITARNHSVPIRAGYDGRLSPVDSTKAAVRYLKILHSMFAGDWRLAVMAYNAGEYRVLGALRRSGQNARNAKPETLPGMSGITHAYVQKLRALSCLLEQADDREDWLQALDRPVPVLGAQVLPAQVRSLDAWARAEGHDPAMLRRLNPVFSAGIARADLALRVLAPVAAAPATGSAEPAAESGAPGVGAFVVETSAGSASMPSASARSHTVSRGESAWSIARRYGISTSELLARNGLDARGRLRPGMVLKIDATASE
jgi:membrane-bound lytic murein transglycosylase D